MHFFELVRYSLSIMQVLLAYFIDYVLPGKLNLRNYTTDGRPQSFKYNAAISFLMYCLLTCCIKRGHAGILN